VRKYRIEGRTVCGSSSISVDRRKCAKYIHVYVLIIINIETYLDVPIFKPFVHMVHGLHCMCISIYIYLYIYISIYRYLSIYVSMCNAYLDVAVLEPFMHMVHSLH
jgi:hypothetical protein